MAELVNAMGYELDFDGIEDEEEIEILRAWRRAKANPPQHLSVRGALLLPSQRPEGEHARPLRRLRAKALQDRRETLE